MSLPTSGVLAGEVRVDPADWLEYRYVSSSWVLNTPSILQPLASSTLFPSGTKVGEVKVDSNTGVSYKWSGSEWVLQSNLIAASSLATGVANPFGTAIDITEVGDGMMITKSVVLTRAQILALVATPATLIAAPGSGKQINIVSVSVKRTGGTYVLPKAMSTVDFIPTPGYLAQNPSIVCGTVPALGTYMTSSATYIGELLSGTTGVTYVKSSSALPSITPNTAVTLRFPTSSYWETGFEAVTDADLDGGTLTVYLTYSVIPA